MKAFVLILLLFSFQQLSAQHSDNMTLPFADIQEYPDNYNSGNIIVRLIDGLGFRYYWATEGLTEKDLVYRPTPEASDAQETIQHIYELSLMILNAASNTANDGSVHHETLAFSTARQKTLNNLKSARTLLEGLSAEQVSTLQVSFLRGEKQSDFPLWHLINGPITDAIYHTGQIVSFRRTSGNPINPKVSVFSGKLRE